MGVTATDLAQIPMSADLGSTLTRGSEFAEATGAGEVTLEHLLHALCDDPDAIAVLDASQINIEGLRADVTARAYQGGVQSQSPSSGGLAVSHDVRRILEAAAAAARGSRRRDINGAIVLAAIVGDARSMAAEILQAHGLNFDNAIRALQAALAPVRDVPAQVPVTDDVLARARERVQSRSAPSLRDMMKDLPRVAPPQPVAVPETTEKVEKAPPAPAEAAPPAEAPVASVPPSAGAAAEAPAEEARQPSPVFIPQTTISDRGARAPVSAPAPVRFPLPLRQRSMLSVSPDQCPPPLNPLCRFHHIRRRQDPAVVSIRHPNNGPHGNPDRRVPVEIFRTSSGRGRGRPFRPRFPPRVRFQACPPALILAPVPVCQLPHSQIHVLVIGLYRALRHRSSGRSEAPTNVAASR